MPAGQTTGRTIPRPAFQLHTASGRTIVISLYAPMSEAAAREHLAFVASVQDEPITEAVLFDGLVIVHTITSAVADLERRAAEAFDQWSDEQDRSDWFEDIAREFAAALDRERGLRDAEVRS